MALNKIKGAPTRHTAGGVGAKLVDITTGKQYVCTFAYCNNGVWEYDWKETGVVEKVNDTKLVEPEKIVEVKTEEPVVVQNEVKVDIPAEEVPVTPVRQPQRTNYTQYSKKTK